MVTFRRMKVNPHHRTFRRMKVNAHHKAVALGYVLVFQEVVD